MQTTDFVETAASLEQVSLSRHPIVDAQRNVVAYELSRRSDVATEGADAGQASSVLQALVENAALLASAKTDLFIACPHTALDGPHWDFVDPSKTVIAVPLVRGHVPEHIASVTALLVQLRTRGFRFAFGRSVVSPVYESWHGMADFIRVELLPGSQANIPALFAAIKARTSATVIGHQIEHAEQFEFFKDLGVERFQGEWFSVPEVVQPRMLSPGEANALKLFNMVRSEASLDAVELLLKKDAVLGVSLLRIINSAAMGLKQSVTSLRQAVQLMGYHKLGRWSAMLMISASQSSTSLLGASSVVRARMMELLAEHNLSVEEAGAAFLVGLLSQLDRMLGIPMDVLVERLDLDPEISAALLHRRGKFGPMLALVLACESVDEQAFAEAFSLLNYTNHQVNMAHLEALVWCDNVG
jgi:EAL and modified HD-GYP domain-containing signal transduction protein